jgi:hypothetical protein
MSFHGVFLCNISGVFRSFNDDSSDQ